MESGIRGLAGVILWTSPERFEAMAGFYRDVLLLPTRSERPGFINFEWAESRLTVTVHDRVQGHNRDPLRIMINLATDDIMSLHTRLTGAGVAFARAPARENWGGLVATVNDPDGNTIQFLEMP